MQTGIAFSKHCLYHSMPLSTGHSRMVCPDGLSSVIGYIVRLFIPLPFSFDGNIGNRSCPCTYPLSDTPNLGMDIRIQRLIRRNWKNMSTPSMPRTIFPAHRWNTGLYLQSFLEREQDSIWKEELYGSNWVIAFFAERGKIKKALIR